MPKGTRSSARGSRAGGVVEVIRTPKHSTLGIIVGLLMRSRAELLVLVAVIAAGLYADSLVGWTGMWISLGVLVAVVFAVPWSRRYCTARMWCVLDRHRIRSALAEARVRTMTRDGSLPYLLWARPTKTGERVRVFLRAGCSAEDVQAALDYVAPACLAREARMERTKRQSALVYIDIIRRDPLEKQTAHVSPLVRWFGSTKHADDNSSEVTPISSARQVRSTSPEHTESDSRAASTTKTVAGNNEDLSDYID